MNAFSCDPDLNNYYIKNSTEQISTIHALNDNLAKKGERQGFYLLDYFEPSDKIRKIWYEGAGKLFNYNHLLFMIESSSEAFELFAEMLENVKLDVITTLSKVQVRGEDDVDAVEEQRRREAEAHGVQYQHEQGSAIPKEEQVEENHTPFVREGEKVGRNSPCPCGSGKKYKQCHGKIS